MTVIRSEEEQHNEWNGEITKQNTESFRKERPRERRFSTSEGTLMNIKKFEKNLQNQLDRQALEGATSGWMEENVSQAIYNGGNEIKLPKMSLQGLGSYDRDAGYSGGAVTYSYETFALTQDRGGRFRIDAIDVDESGFGLAAANVAAEFQRTQVIPEIDAYRYSKLAAAAEIKDTYTPDKATVMSSLLAQLGEVRDITGDEGDVVIVMSRPVYDKLMLSDESKLKPFQFRQGSLEFFVKSINGIPIIPVPSKRMQTEYIFDANGFFPAIRAEPINWIICPKSAPIAISKTDSVKIIPPGDNQFADAWDIDYRKYHDLLIPDNTKALIAVSVASEQEGRS